MPLENKLGITNSATLAKEEERISKTRAVELFESGLLASLPAGTFDTLCRIHAHLFSDIYGFAGKLRTVNMSKGNFRFAPLMYLGAALESIEKMPQRTFDEIVEKYVEMNIAHPFREGNGRATRIWLDHILKAEIGMVVEGYHALEAAIGLSRKYGVAMPITEAVFDIIKKGRSPADAMEELMSRHIKNELES